VLLDMVAGLEHLDGVRHLKSTSCSSSWSRAFAPHRGGRHRPSCEELHPGHVAVGNKGTYRKDVDFIKEHLGGLRLPARCLATTA